MEGGVAQGLGQAMMENAVFDNSGGQLVTGSFMDYAMPRADDLPHLVVETAKGTPCTHNPLGVKGCGEAGAIAAFPAIANALLDALAPFGIETIEGEECAVVESTGLVKGKMKDDDGKPLDDADALRRWAEPAAGRLATTLGGSLARCSTTSVRSSAARATRPASLTGSPA